jgi:hypothetical protein
MSKVSSPKSGDTHPGPAQRGSCRDLWRIPSDKTRAKITMKSEINYFDWAMGHGPCSSSLFVWYLYVY